MTINPTPFPDSYWVIPQRFLAGEYPGAHDERMAAHKIHRLLGANITHFIDLTCPNDAIPYAPLLAEEASLMDMTIVHERHPILDFYIPTVEQMVAILDSIDHALAENKNIYVHCIGGIGRTGTTVGCHLVRHGMRAEEALERIKVLRKDVPDWWVNSPENETQRQFVLNWKSGQ